MLLSFQTRFSGMETNKLYVLPTLLDPRFKGRVFSSSAAVIQGGQLLVEEFLVFQSSNSKILERNDSVSAKRRCTDNSPEKSSLWSSFDEMMAIGEQTDVEITQSLSSAEVAIDSFLQEPVQPRKSSPLKYWQQKKVLYPILAKMAIKYLSIPAASTASERLFSTARNIITDQRNCLDPDRAEMLLFLNKNLRLFIKDN